MILEKKREYGFTLLEMVVVVAIIAILAAIAVPSYQRYILKSHRVDARNVLQSAAQKLEQNFSINRTYACKENAKKAECKKNKINDDWLKNMGLYYSPANSDSDTYRYKIRFVGEPEDRSYQLQAIPSRIQSRDKCGTFVLNQNGVKQVQKEGGEVSSGGIVQTVEGRKLAAACWSS